MRKLKMVWGRALLGAPAWAVYVSAMVLCVLVGLLLVTLESRLTLAMGGLLAPLLMALLAGAALGWAINSTKDSRNSNNWEIAQGLRKREFFVHYQPIVTAQSGHCIGVEVLARWRHPVQGFIPSQLFIPAAEEAGLIVALTRYLLRCVGYELGQMMLPAGFVVGVNISASHLTTRDIIEDCRLLLSVLKDKHIQLVLEVSERVALEEHEESLKVVRELKAMGVQLALDDFGAGHADRHYLQTWGFDYLKVEKGYVSAIGKEGFRGNILDDILVNATQLGLKVMIKGVETQGQQSYLNAKGFQFLQGFFFGRPMTLNHFRRWLYAEVASESESPRPAAPRAEGT
ncbi:EAL domain-containing protein [Pseudogulbenkiania subflava]|uniref:EAL domain, c-di-GMP-specific phosphodiesterase class I (Or its enzymatically inactive variant) n=1 Tax=Pseudogulbenkiania subflava DSM 22618 TaxID=1123014 RepID=A0A1Y6C0D4_9NEIS|nr:EAL domain-containing protein [Pseudogulbenkiania subflava]SMF38940.1 EAL domain, c-di-GMP-specific phosphodiesterase class I (or its enzymatically inactive variant) [Pseudogulbenkiania subflava DSM 22618]